jgi:hypothetical protein
MRLRLFDRIRRFAHPRRSRPVNGNGPQGRHRREQQQAAAVGAAPPGLAGHPAPGPPAGTLTGLGPGPPEAWPVPDQTFADPPPFADRSLPVDRPVPVDRPAGGYGPPPGHRLPPASSRRKPGPAAVRSGQAQARVREAPDQADPFSVAHEARPEAAVASSPVRAYDPLTAPDLAQAAAGIPQQSGADGRPSWRGARAALRLKLPFTSARAREASPSADGRRHTGSLERILWRQWDAAISPPAQVIEAIDRLAELPERIKSRLAAGLDAIFVGPGGVPELDEMGALRGVPLPSGQASWDACAGAYGERKIVVGSQPSPTPDVMCHEIGHALDDLDSPPGKWQSDSAEFRMLYDQCQPHFASDFHRQPGGLGRKEFFADAFAAIASSQRPALVDMLSGDTRTALRVMLYFNRRYGI